ncbi:trichohyalin-like [Notechis scutatus]|uniref:Trichohyalin-like n=1 Tax=Notechis scutatus TaxID=8663 RepID=A0A6J1VKV8_9SAUR|nr:trichohyalin-like [Notechis scutatus]
MTSWEMDCREWQLQLPDSKEAPSRSESICTEDLADEFHKGLVNVLLSSDEDEAPSGLASGPRDLRPPTSHATILPEMAGPCPAFRSLHPDSDSPRLESTSQRWPAEASKEKRSQELAPHSREGPLQSLPQQGVKNVEAPREKGSVLRQNCSVKSSSGTDIGRGGQPWKRSPHARLQSAREEAKLLGGKERLTPPELGMDPGVIYGPRDAEKTPALARRPRETWAVALSADVHGEVPERGETGGPDVKKPQMPARNPWRSSSSSVFDVDEEPFAQLAGQKRTSSNFRRADLVLLEYKRDIYLKEVVELEEELSLLRRQGRKYGALQVEALLSQKDLEIARMHKNLSGLEVEKEALDGIVQSLKKEHQQQLKKVQQDAFQEKEKDLCKLREEMQLQEKRALQKCVESSEVAKASALQEQAVTFQKEIEDLQKILKEREAEVIQLQEAMQKQAMALKANEVAQDALHQEQKKWEANAQAALRMQREVLGEQDRRRQADLQRALEKERKLNRALRNEAGDLRQKIEGLENQARLLEEEKRASLEELQVGLQKEKDEALQRLREELEQERMQEREEMRTKLQQMKEGEEHLQVECSRMSLREQEAWAQADQMDHFWATQVAIACQQLQEVLPEKAALRPHLLCRGVLPLSSGAALQALREVKEEIQSYIQDLNHELEQRRQRISQIQREKEVELRQQKEQLHLESRSVLEALKEQLVQEHMNDILALQRSWLKEGQGKDNPGWDPSLGKLHAAQKKVVCEKDDADHTPIHQPKGRLERDGPWKNTGEGKEKQLGGSEGRKSPPCPRRTGETNRKVEALQDTGKAWKMWVEDVDAAVVHWGEAASVCCSGSQP